LEQLQGLSEQDQRDRERARAAEMSRAQTLASAEAEGTEKASIGLRGAHWTQKPLAAMTERDWRIFREDFDIRVKGGKAPLPLRNWEEGHLADSITQVTRHAVVKKILF
jgi:ATP-dependent RNA helicase DDX23/PRP28